MKAAPFEYTVAHGLDEAVALLAEGGEDAMIIAGGQTLVPMMAMRLARPTRLVDINKVPELAGMVLDSGQLRIKAGTRQATALAAAELKENVPLLVKALGFVGHVQTRNRGTVGGSLAHGDPAAEISLVAVALDARLTLRSTGATRQLGADEFLEGPMITARRADECLTEIAFPVWREEGSLGSGFQEVSQRHGDFAIVAAAVQLLIGADGVCRRAAIAVGGAHPYPLRMAAAEQRLVGQAIDQAATDQAAGEVEAHLQPDGDTHASADYRRRVARRLVARAIGQAAAEACSP